MRWIEAWTLSRASWCGAAAGVAALLLWPAFAMLQGPLRLPFVLALAACAFCGLSILAITIADLLRVRRDRRLRPLRAFDLLFGALLAGPALLALQGLIAW